MASPQAPSSKGPSSKNQSSKDSPSQPPSVQGRFPNVDLVLVKDRELSGLKNVKCDNFFRIHMDIEIKPGDVKTIDDALESLNYQAVYNVLKASFGPDTGGLADKTLKAALGLT